MFVSLKKRQSLGQHCSSVLALPCPSPPSRPFTSCLYCSPSLIRAFNRLQTAPGNEVFTAEQGSLQLQTSVSPVPTHRHWGAAPSAADAMATCTTVRVPIHSFCPQKIDPIRLGYITLRSLQGLGDPQPHKAPSTSGFTRREELSCSTDTSLRSIAGNLAHGFSFGEEGVAFRASDITREIFF